MCIHLLKRWNRNTITCTKSSTPSSSTLLTSGYWLLLMIRRRLHSDRLPLARNFPSFSLMLRIESLEPRAYPVTGGQSVNEVIKDPSYAVCLAMVDSLVNFGTTDRIPNRSPAVNLILRSLEHPSPLRCKEPRDPPHEENGIPLSSALQVAKAPVLQPMPETHTLALRDPPHEENGIPLSSALQGAKALVLQSMPVIHTLALRDPKHTEHPGCFPPSVFGDDSDASDDSDATGSLVSTIPLPTLVKRPVLTCIMEQERHHRLDNSTDSLPSPTCPKILSHHQLEQHCNPKHSPPWITG
eukprot:sb/3467434/